MLDVCFKISMQRAAHLFATGIADSLQLLAHRLPGLVAPAQTIIKIVDPGEYPRGDHGRCKPAAFLVGPTDCFDGTLGFKIEIVQCADNLKAGQDSVNPVEPAAGRLSIKVTTY